VHSSAIATQPAVPAPREFDEFMDERAREVSDLSDEDDAEKPTKKA